MAGLVIDLSSDDDDEPAPTTSQQRTRRSSRLQREDSGASGDCSSQYSDAQARGSKRGTRASSRGRGAKRAPSGGSSARRPGNFRTRASATRAVQATPSIDLCSDDDGDVVMLAPSSVSVRTTPSAGTQTHPLAEEAAPDVSRTSNSMAADVARDVSGTAPPSPGTPRVIWTSFKAGPDSLAADAIRTGLNGAAQRPMAGASRPVLSERANHAVDHPSGLGSGIKMRLHVASPPRGASAAAPPQPLEQSRGESRDDTEVSPAEGLAACREPQGVQQSIPEAKLCSTKDAAQARVLPDNPPGATTRAVTSPQVNAAETLPVATTRADSIPEGGAAVKSEDAGKGLLAATHPDVADAGRDSCAKPHSENSDGESSDDDDDLFAYDKFVRAVAPPEWNPSTVPAGEAPCASPYDKNLGGDTAADEHDILFAVRNAEVVARAEQSSLEGVKAPQGPSANGQALSLPRKNSPAPQKQPAASSAIPRSSSLAGTSDAAARAALLKIREQQEEVALIRAKNEALVREAELEPANESDEGDDDHDVIGAPRVLHGPGATNVGPEPARSAGGEGADSDGEQTSGGTGADEHAESEKILLTFATDSAEYKFRFSKSDTLQKAFQKCAERMQVPLASLRFRFDGEQVTAGQTPEGLDLEDEDTIDIIVV